MDKKPSNQKNNKDYNSKNRSIWLVAFILLELVLVSFFIVCVVLLFEFRDKLPDEEIDVSRGEFQVVDDEGKWTTHTQIHLFKSHYENGSISTVVAGNGTDNLIAPGTANDYEFQLVNCGNTVIDYNVEIKFTQSESWQNLTIPVRIKLVDGEGRCYFKNGPWLNWADAPEVTKDGTLDIKKTDKFVICWEWPFDNGDDITDTNLGNLALDEDLFLTVDIVVTAQQSVRESVNSFNLNVLWWILIVFILFAIVLVLITLIKYLSGNKKQKEKNKQNNDNSNGEKNKK